MSTSLREQGSFRGGPMGRPVAFCPNPYRASGPTSFRLPAVQKMLTGCSIRAGVRSWQIPAKQSQPS